MPVIVLGNRGSLPIDPDFDDGGIVQVANTAIDEQFGFISPSTINVSGTSVSIGIVGSGTFLGDLTPTSATGSVITGDGGFFTDVVQSAMTTPTPNIVAPPSVPTPSAPDGGPTVGDFDDDGVVQVVVTSVVTTVGGFITNDPVHDVIPVTSTVQASSSAFTQGLITSGTIPAPDAGTTVDGGDAGFSLGVETTIPGQVVS